MIAAAPASAHRRDEYLQAARLAIEPDRVELSLDLTPGIAVAEQVLAEIDRDRNRSMEPAEGRAYAARLFQALALELDGIPLRIELADTILPTVDAVLKGNGTMRIQACAALPGTASGAHRLRYRNRHWPEFSVYLATALVPASERVSLTAQRRDPDQRELTIEYTLAADAATRMRGGATAALTGALIWAAVWRRRQKERT